MYVAIHQSAGGEAEFSGYPKATLATQTSCCRVTHRRAEPRPTQADNFLVTFGKPSRLLVCECERSSETTLGQTFQLISGPEISRLIGAPENRIGELLKAKKTDAEIIEELYWSALTRAPSESERAVL